MVGYIYQIQNIITNQSYIGQTVDIYRRQRVHFRKLRNNKHGNPKLQASWNKYGEQNFSFTYWTFYLNSPEELNSLECEYIEKFNSLENGFNLIPGGTKPPLHQRVKDDDVVTFLCVYEMLGDGYGKSCEQIFGWPKGSASAAKRRIRYPNAQLSFEALSSDERRERAESFIKSQKLNEIALSRQLTQGGSERAYKLTDDDYFFAFCCQDMGYKASKVAHYLQVSEATVYDWFNGRHRQKEKQRFLELPEEEKLIYKKRVEEIFSNNN